MKTIVKTVKSSSGIRVNAAIKSGGLYYNHSRRGLALKIKSGIKAGEGILQVNHSRNIG
jgi:hypothetical protein